MKTTLQKLGKSLSAMVMPNIGAFIAWGFITALFIADGWLPNEQLASIQPYMLTYLLPVLIAATGGRMVGGDRGLVMGSIAILGYYIIGPFMTGILTVLTYGVDILVNKGLIPLVAIFIEPAKVLFLNNAINHGIFTPIGAEQAAQTGKSIMYMLEANPGPGLGVLLAYWLFAKDKATKDSAPGAIIIHFLGGIHEIYFPYILMNPVVIVAPILGNICAIAFYSIFNIGLKGPSSPGSIIAFLSMAEKGSVFMTALGVLIAAGVSFLVASPIVKLAGEKNLDEASKKMQSMKAESKGRSEALLDVSLVRKIVFACDAGMGSSAMGATKFRNRLKGVRPDLTVINTSVDNIPVDCDVAVVQETLVERAKKSAPFAKIVTISNFLADPVLDNLFFQLSTGDSIMTEAVKEEDEIKPVQEDVIQLDGIKLNLPSVSKEEAITEAGKLLRELGYVDGAYIPAMLEREELVTTYIGMGLAIPHGTTHGDDVIHKTGIVLLQYPDGIQFGDEKAQLVIGIAGKGGEHMEVLSKICLALEDETVLNKMKTTNDKEWILKQLS